MGFLGEEAGTASHNDDERAGGDQLTYINDPFVLTFPSSSTTFLERPRLWIETLSTLQTVFVTLAVLATQIFGPAYGFWSDYTNGTGKAQCIFAGAYSLAMGFVLLAATAVYVAAIRFIGSGSLIAEQRLTVALLLTALLQMTTTLPAENGQLYPFVCNEDWVFQKRVVEDFQHCRDKPEPSYTEACVIAEHWPDMVCNVTTAVAKTSFFKPCGPTDEYVYNFSATTRSKDASGGVIEVPCNVSYRPWAPWYVYVRFDPDEYHQNSTGIEADIHETPCCVKTPNASGHESGGTPGSAPTIGRDWCRKTCPDGCPDPSKTINASSTLWDVTETLVVVAEYSWAHLFTTDPSKAVGGWYEGASGGLFSVAIIAFYLTIIGVSSGFHVDLNSVQNYVIALLFMRMLFKANAALKRMPYLRTRARQLLFWAMMFPVGVRRFTIGVFIALMYDGLEEDEISSQ